MVLLRYLAFPPVGSPGGAITRAASLRAPAPAALKVPAPPRPARPSAAAPAPVVAAAEPGPAPLAAAAADPALSERWNELVRRLIDTAAVSGLVRELAWQSVLVAIESGAPVAWHLRVEHEALRSAGLRDKLAAAVSEAIGAPLRLVLEAGTPADSPAQREAAERQRRQRQAEQTIHDDPVVRELMSQFKSARIVPGSIKPL
jgi:DNA polymerase-3 subunit gamma/tau